MRKIKSEIFYHCDEVRDFAERGKLIIKSDKDALSNVNVVPTKYKNMKKLFIVLLFFTISAKADNQIRNVVDTLSIVVCETQTTAEDFSSKYSYYMYEYSNNWLENEKGVLLDITKTRGGTIIKKIPCLNKDTIKDNCIGCELGFIMEPSVFGVPSGDSLVEVELRTFPLFGSVNICEDPRQFFLGTSPFTYKYSFKIKKPNGIEYENSLRPIKSYGIIQNHQNYFKVGKVIFDSFKNRFLDNINLDIAPRYHIEFIAVFDRDGSFKKIYLRDLWIESTNYSKRTNFSLTEKDKLIDMKLKIDTNSLFKVSVFKNNFQVLSSHQRNNFRTKSYSCSNCKELVHEDKIRLYCEQNTSECHLSETKFIKNIYVFYDSQYQTSWNNTLKFCEENEGECEQYDLNLNLFEEGDFMKKLQICTPANIQDFFKQYQFIESKLCQMFPSLPLKQIINNLKSMPKIEPGLYIDEFSEGNSRLKNEIHNTAIKVYLTKESDSTYFFNVTEYLNTINKLR